jgi:hypothetical protein
MKKSIWLRALCAVVMSVVLGWTPDPVFAQRGGGFHGGGGGFHGGGGGFYGGYRGGAYYGGRGGFYPGWRGGYYRYPGYYGWRGGYGGYPGFGYGWGFNFGFGWGWPAYPYAYGYSPWVGSYYYPYYYPYPVSYDVPSNDPAPYAYPSYGSSYDSRTMPPTAHSSVPTPPIPPNHNSESVNVASFKPADPDYRMTDAAAGHYRPPNSSMRQLPPSRREVQNVIRALHAMPPDAAQRQIDSGRYSNFSPEERQFLYSAVLPPAGEKTSQSVPHPLLYARAGE